LREWTRAHDDPLRIEADNTIIDVAAVNPTGPAFDRCFDDIRGRRQAQTRLDDSLRSWQTSGCRCAPGLTPQLPLHSSSLA
jgi:hypothetical protein